MVHDCPELYRKIISYALAFLQGVSLNYYLVIVHLTMELPGAVAQNEHFVVHQVWIVLIKSCFQSTNRNGVQDFVVHGLMLYRAVHK